MSQVVGMVKAVLPPTNAPIALIGLVACVVSAYLVAQRPIEVALYTILCGLLLLVSFLHTRAAIYLIIFSMLLSPEIGLGPPTGGRAVSIRLEDLLLVLVGIAWLARVAYYKESGLLRKSPLNRPIAVYTLAAITATVVSGWTNPTNWLNALLFLGKYLEYFVLYFLVLNHIDSRKDIKNFLTAAILTCIVVSCIGIAQIPGGNRVSAPFEGEVGEPNSFGGYLVLMLSLAGGFYLMTSSFIKRTYWMGFAVLLVIPLAYTLSRSSWGAALVMLLVLFWYGPRKSHLLAIGGLALTLYPLLTPQQIVNRLDYTFNQPESVGQVHVGNIKLDTSLSARIASWRYGLKGWARRPITGYGVAGFGFMDAQYVRVLTETGIFGFVAFCWLAISIWRMSLQRFRNATEDFTKALSLGYLAAFAAMLAHGLGANTFIIIRIMEPFWLLTALVVSLPEGHPAESVPSQSVPAISDGANRAGA